MSLVSECWFLTGATASGKTDVGLELAERLGAEIISMDSMALYRGMDIGTAKPSADQRRRIAHHLIDVAEPHQEFSLAQYVAAAQQCAAEVAARGRGVLFVGGTPLYLKGLLRGIFEGPAADATLRTRLQAEAAEHGSQRLHERLSKVDPTAAARLHANDERRLIRALEVYQITGRPISHWQQQFDTGRPAGECRVFVLDWPRPTLHERIEQRVAAMFAAGLVAEVAALLARPQPLSRSAGQGVGYREVVDHIEGRQTLAETIELVKRHTRQLAKRQNTWFRSLSECQFVAMHAGRTAEDVAAEIVSRGLPSASQ
jgi:tRNA dimethylallyltransferase